MKNNKAAKKGNYPRFLYVSNMLAAPGREFVVFTGHPSWIAEVFPFDTVEDAIIFEGEFMLLQDEKGITPVGARTTWHNKHYVLAVLNIFTPLPQATGEALQKSADNLARTARRMADWYRYNILKSKEDLNEHPQ